MLVSKMMQGRSSVRCHVDCEAVIMRVSLLHEYLSLAVYVDVYRASDGESHDDVLCMDWRFHLLLERIGWSYVSTSRYSNRDLSRCRIR